MKRSREGSMEVKNMKKNSKKKEGQSKWPRCPVSIGALLFFKRAWRKRFGFWACPAGWASAVTDWLEGAQRKAQSTNGWLPTWI